MHRPPPQPLPAPPVRCGERKNKRREKGWGYSGAALSPGLGNAVEDIISVLSLLRPSNQEQKRSRAKLLSSQTATSLPLTSFKVSFLFYISTAPTSCSYFFPLVSVFAGTRGREDPEHKTRRPAARAGARIFLWHFPVSSRFRSGFPRGGKQSTPGSSGSH